MDFLSNTVKLAWNKFEKMFCTPKNKDNQFIFEIEKVQYTCFAIFTILVCVFTIFYFLYIQYQLSEVFVVIFRTIIFFHFLYKKQIKILRALFYGASIGFVYVAVFLLDYHGMILGGIVALLLLPGI